MGLISGKFQDIIKLCGKPASWQKARYKMIRTGTFLLLMIAHNLAFGQNRINDSLIYQLQIIERDDQYPRIQIDSITRLYAGDSLKLMISLN